MEKYSAYRDAGTGIQPFLTPVPPSSVNGGSKALLLPVRLIAGALRLALCTIMLLLYILLVDVVCLLFLPVPPLHRAISSALTAVLARLSLLFMGFYWISVNVVPRKRGRAGKDTILQPWRPKAGDLIVSNWVSYFEVLWLAFRFNPTFVLPVVNPPASGYIGSPSRATGRKTGTGSANVSLTTASAPHSQSPILGFCEVSLFKMLSTTGCVPPFGINPASSSTIRPLEEIRKNAGRPVVVFPECTTSNGRALLRFANIFGENPPTIPVWPYRIFMLCVRYDAPTVFSPTLTLPLPRSPVPGIQNLIHHFFSMSLMPSISIRLLPPSESPSSATFVVSDVVSDDSNSARDAFREACETLVAGLGKLKRTQLGWEEKSGLMELYYNRAR